MLTKTLYKYKAFNEHAKSIIRDSQIYFANAIELNDPFDCRLAMSFSGIEHDYLEYMRTNLREKRRELLPLDEERLHKSLKGLHTALDTARQEIVEKSGVFSMSEMNDSTIMYSHYADSHRGLCFEFTIPENNNVGILRAVDYMDAFPELNQRELPNAFDPETDASTIEMWGEKLFSLTYFSKASSWAYEREWRWLRRSPGVVAIPRQTLTGIILGCRMTAQDETSVYQLLDGREQCVSVYRATDRPNSYGMRIASV